MSKKITVIILAVVFGIGGVALFFADQPSTQSIAAQEMPAAKEEDSGEKKHAEVNLASIPDVIASVNDVEIKKETYIRIIESVKKELEGGGEVLTPEMLAQVTKNIVDTLVSNEVIYQEAKKNNMDTSDEEVEKIYQSIKSRFKDEAAFQEALKGDGATEADLRVEIKKGETIQKLITSQVSQNVNINEETAKEYFEQNREVFKKPEMVSARHILIKLDADASEDKVKEATDRINEIRGKAEGGESFEELAKTYSEGPTAPRGGDLGFFPKGAMVKEFEDAAFLLKEGEMSGPVRTRFGLHLIKVTGRKAAGVPEFEEVKEEIQQDLINQAKSSYLRSYISDLKKKADVKTFL